MTAKSLERSTGSQEPDRASAGSARSPERRRRAAWLALLLAGGLWLALVGAPLPPTARAHRSADGSAFRGLAWLLDHGRVSGRDFTAAYGAVPQALARAGVALRGGDWAGAVPSIYLVLSATAWLLLIAWLALLPLPGGARGLPLAAAAVVAGWPWSFPFLRLAAALLAARACAAWLIDERDGGDVVRPAAAGLATAALWLVSFDYVLYLAAAALVAAGLALAPGPWRDATPARLARRSAVYLVAVASSLGGLSALAAATAADPGRNALEPLRATWELALTYPRTFGVAWTGGAVESAVWAALVVGAVVGALHSSARRAGRPLRADLLVLAPLSLLALKGATTRSDSGHVALGLAPALLLCVLVAVGPGGSRRVRVAVAALAVAAAMLYPGRPAVARAAAVETWNPIGAARSLRRVEPARDLFPARVVALAARRPDAPLAVFPLRIGLAALAGRPLVAIVDQLYAAHTPEMQERVAVGLDRAGPELEVIFGLDRHGTWAVDGVPSIARSPVVFEYLLRHFDARPAEVLDGGQLLLARRSRERALRWRDVGAGELASAGGGRRRSRFATPRPCPLMRLTLRLGYPPAARIGWPAGVRVRATAAGREVIAARLVPLELGRRFRVDLSPLGGERFARLFFPGVPPTGPRIDALELAAEDGGPFGVAPESIELLGVQCLE